MDNTNSPESNTPYSTELPASLLNSVKLNLIVLSTLPISALIFGGLGFLSLYLNSMLMLYVSAILFFVLPLASIKYVKKICIQPAVVNFTDTMLSVSQKDKETVIYWQDVKSYKIRRVSGLHTDEGFIVTFFFKNEMRKRKFYFIDAKITAFGGKLLREGLLFNLCSAIKSYNTQTSDELSWIQPSLNSMTKLLRSILIFLSISLLIFDIIYRVKHPNQIKSFAGLFMTSIILMLSALGQRVTEKRLLKKIEDL